MSSHDRLRPFFLQPSTGDKLLSAANRAVITVDRWPGEPLDGGEPETEIGFELKGSLAASSETAGLIRSLLREFNTPRQRRRPDEGRGDAAGNGGEL